MQQWQQKRGRGGVERRVKRLVGREGELKGKKEREGERERKMERQERAEDKERGLREGDRLRGGHTSK